MTRDLLSFESVTLHGLGTFRLTMMPTMDGLEFLTRVRSMPGFADLPILAITSEAQKAETIASQQHYGFHVLLKPVLPAALLEQVQRLLPLE